MKIFPIDLLRTFVTVIDLDSYTRAGERLGRSQPAISLQLKRLQEMVGAPLFVRGATTGAGASQLTETGHLVANYARRILALNDEMGAKLARSSLAGRVAIGIPNDYADHFLPRLLEDRRIRDIGAEFEVTCDLSFNLLEGLREGRFDLVVAMTMDAPAEGAFVTWRERLTWVGRREAVGRKGTTEALRLVASPEGCLYRRQMVTSLQRVGRACEIVYTSPSLPGLEAAIVSGFGISVFAERILPERLRALPPLTGLPTLNDLMVGIYIGKGERQTEAASLAAHLAELLGTTE